MKMLICILSVLIATAVQVSAIGSRTDIADECYPMVPEECPQSGAIAECSTCCCASEDVEFYDPDAPEPECTAKPAMYEMRFIATWSLTCNPDYYFINDSIWSPPTGASHNPEYRMWDACMDDASLGVELVSQTGNTSVINMEYKAAGDKIYDTTQGELIIGGSGMTYNNITIDQYHQWISAISMLVPSQDRMVGVADVRLCEGKEWKKSVKVCTELFSTASKSDRVAPDMERNSLQANNCSFAYFRFTYLGPATAGASAMTAPVTTLLAVLVFVATVFHHL